MSILDFISDEEAKAKEEAAKAEQENAETEAEMDEAAAEGDDKTSEEEAECEVEVLDEDDHQENLEEIRELEEQLKDNESLEHLTVSLYSYADSLEHICSTEALSPESAGILANHGETVQAFIHSHGGTGLAAIDKSIFSPEQFKSEETTIEQLSQIGLASAEDIKATAKRMIDKVVQGLINAAKRVYEIVMKLFANEEKLKARVDSALKKAQDGGWTSPTGDRKCDTALQVDGKYDPEAAVKSFRDHGAQIISNADIKFNKGQENLKKLIEGIQKGDESLLKSYAGKKVGKDAEDAKIIAKLGGNINVGVGNGCLYSVDVKAGGDKKCRPLEKSKIVSLLGAVRNDYDAMSHIKKAVAEAKDSYKDFEKASQAVMKAKEVGKIDSLVVGAITKLSKKSGINVLNQVAARTYITSVAAVKLAEWSMSGNSKLPAKA